MPRQCMTISWLYVAAPTYDFTQTWHHLSVTHVLLWFGRCQSMLCCMLFHCAAASQNRVVAELQVFLAWHQAQQEAASQQMLKQLQQTHMADHHYRKVFSRHSLRAWHKGTAISKEESAAQIRREQTWTKVQGWLAESNLSTGSTVCSGTSEQVACTHLAWCCHCAGSACITGYMLVCAGACTYSVYVLHVHRRRCTTTSLLLTGWCRTRAARERACSLHAYNPCCNIIVSVKSHGTVIFAGRHKQ